MGALDLLYLSIGVVFFLAADGFVAGIDRLAGKNAKRGEETRR